MPKRTDIRSILVIGSGPIVIGQACEFDYSGVQACKALREEGYRVILVNSNPATIMTDPEFADRTYIEPIIPEMIEKIIARDKPDALLPTLGGQTALNCAMDLHRSGILKKYDVEMIGANAHAIEKGEDRELFKQAMIKIGLDVPRSGTAHDLKEALRVGQEIGTYPLIIRPAFTLGGTGGGIAYNREEFEGMAQNGIELSPVSEILIEESLLGWKEFELEVMRDCKDNCVIICSIENFDPMGVHTGDSITVAPAQTLTDREYQFMRDAAFRCIREIGVETGGSNIQFAVHPQTGRLVIIEMNPRVSRSSALASKATGFPIAKIAAKLAVGYTLDEIPNDITRETPASFEPTIDYVVTKIPRFAFEKFAGTDTTLTTSMKSVGEAMAIGRTFKESFQKALRSLETGRFGFGADGKDKPPLDNQGQLDRNAIQKKLINPNAERVFHLRYAMEAGMSLEEIHGLTKIDPWFLVNLRELYDFDRAFAKNFRGAKEPQQAELLAQAKSLGFSDRQIAFLLGETEDQIRQRRDKMSLRPSYRLVDTCAAEFEAYTPYFYSTYDRGDDEVRKNDRKKVMILGGGPNRIGQGIEFDYCCVHAAFALKDDGFETLMVNSNPETVSTDYDTSDKLFFEPLTLEDVLHIYRTEECWGAIVQFGGQTPLNLAGALADNGVRIIGTSPQSIERAEDRDLFAAMLTKLKIPQPPNGSATNPDEAATIAARLTYPVLVRPSFVLGGRAMCIVHTEEDLRHYMKFAVEASAERPVLVDKFLEDAIEVDVDCIADVGLPNGKTVVVGGMLEHIEYAGVHSGDAAMVMPAHTLSKKVLETIREYTDSMARELKVIGLMNVQYAVKDNTVYVLEVNPRASRTVPFVSKAIGVPLAKLASRVMAGKTLQELGFTREISPRYFCVKESVFPFARFPGVDILLSPEMKSTGEVMGLDEDLGIAYAKSQMAAQPSLPTKGKVFISVRDSDKAPVVPVAEQFKRMGFEVCATSGTAAHLKQQGIDVQPLLKISEGRPNVLDLLKNGEISLIINTPTTKAHREDEKKIRTTALHRKIPIMTTITGGMAAAQGIEALRKKELSVKSIQEYHAGAGLGAGAGVGVKR